MTKGRMALALLLALAADGLQIPFAAPPATEIIDVIAMIFTMVLLGFHVLLLPTFILEFIPVAGMLPTWTACVGTVIVLRRRAETNSSEQPTMVDAAVPPRIPPPAPPKLEEKSKE